jgi:hypothetical protein
VLQPLHHLSPTVEALGTLSLQVLDPAFMTSAVICCEAWARPAELLDLLLESSESSTELLNISTVRTPSHKTCR